MRSAVTVAARNKIHLPARQVVYNRFPSAGNWKYSSGHCRPFRWIYLWQQVFHGGHLSIHEVCHRAETRKSRSWPNCPLSVRKHHTSSWRHMELRDPILRQKCFQNWPSYSMSPTISVPRHTTSQTEWYNVLLKVCKWKADKLGFGVAKSGLVSKHRQKWNNWLLRFWVCLWLRL